MNQRLTQDGPADGLTAESTLEGATDQSVNQPLAYRLRDAHLATCGSITASR